MVNEHAALWRRTYFFCRLEMEFFDEASEFISDIELFKLVISRVSACCFISEVDTWYCDDDVACDVCVLDVAKPLFTTCVCVRCKINHPTTKRKYTTYKTGEPNKTLCMCVYSNYNLLQIDSL